MYTFYEYITGTDEPIIKRAIRERPTLAVMPQLMSFTTPLTSQRTEKHINIEVHKGNSPARVLIVRRDLD